MQAGTLRHRLTLKTVTTSKDSFGGTIEAEATFATVWGAVEPLAGRELMVAQQMQSEVTHKITIRYLAGLTSEMHLYFGTREFQILSVLNSQERDIEMVLMCKELL